VCETTILANNKIIVNVFHLCNMISLQFYPPKKHKILKY